MIYETSAKSYDFHRWHDQPTDKLCTHPFETNEEAPFLSAYRILITMSSCIFFLLSTLGSPDDLKSEACALA